MTSTFLHRIDNDQDRFARNCVVPALWLRISPGRSFWHDVVAVIKTRLSAAYRVDEIANQRHFFAVTDIPGAELFILLGYARKL